MRVQSRAGLSIGCTISCDWRFLRRAAVALLIGLSSGSASAAVWLVDTPDDSIDIAPGDAACADAGGRCSLRGAIMESNALAGADDVWLPVGAETGDDIYYLDLSQPDGDSAAIGDLDIHDDLILRRRPLDGPRIAQIARLGDISTTPNRIIDIHPPARVQIADVAIAFGRLSDPESSGAGLRVLAGAEVLLQRCVLYANFGAARGIALAVHGRAELRGCLVFDNGDAGSPEVIYVGPDAHLDVDNATMLNSSSRNLMLQGPDASAALRRVWFGNGEGQSHALLRDGAQVLIENARIDSGRLEVESASVLRLAHVSGLDLALIADSDADRIELVNSAIAAASACSAPSAALISLGGNVFRGTPPCGLALQPSDQQTGDLRLAQVERAVPTAPTEVMPGSEMFGLAPLPGSPLLDAAIATHCPLLDQFGASRPDVGDPTPRCDSGAIEGPLDPILGDGFEF